MREWRIASGVDVVWHYWLAIRGMRRRTIGAGLAFRWVGHKRAGRWIVDGVVPLWRVLGHGVDRGGGRRR